MRLLLLFLRFCLTVFVLLTWTTPGNGQTVSDTDWTEATPAQIHQHMWESKNRALADQRLAEEQIVQSALFNTQTNYDVTYYDIYIRVNDTNKTLYGSVGFTAKATEPGVSEVQVDIWANMFVDSIIAPSGPLTHSRFANVVTVELGQAYNAGDEFQFVFYYHGQPITGGFQAFSFATRLTVPVMSSLSEPYFARTWWPCKDRMDDKADSFAIAIEVDTGFYVGSNGTLDSTVSTSSNTKTFHYTVHYPMVTYLFSVAISKYTVWYDEYVYNAGADTMPLVHAVYPDRYTYSLGKYNVTPQAIELLSETFGPYPFLDEKYGHSNFEWGGGMEHQTMTSMSGSNFGFSEPVVVHELMHQWFGDMITCEQWGHIWLNEGFASYGEAVYYLNRDGWAAYHSYMAGMEYAGGGPIYVSDTTSVSKIFASIVYDKGAWVVHMLRGVLGESLFATAMDAYVNSEYRHGALTTEEFRDLVEQATGVELDWFFTEWIYGTYRPSYNYASYSEPAASGGWDTYVYVSQVQTTNPQVFTMPIDFFFDYKTAPDDTVTLWVDERREVIKVHTPDSVAALQLDPLKWILRYATIQDWLIRVVTGNADLTAARQYYTYADTVEQRGALGPLDVTLLSGALPQGYSIDELGVISGLTSDTGTFTFTVQIRDMYSGSYDAVSLSLYVMPTSLQGGNINMSGIVDGGDLALLVAYLTNPPDEKPSLPVPAAADVDGSCLIDGSDLAWLVAYLVGDPVPLMVGCAQ